MNQKVLNMILLAIVVVLLGAIGYLVSVKKPTAPCVQPTPTQCDIPDNGNDGSNASEKTFKSSSFEFTYPSVLTATAQDEGVSIIHAVAYRHNDVCDFKGDAPALDKITDFNVSIRLFDSGLKDAMRKNELDAFVTTYFQGDTIKTEPGFIDESNVGSLRGYRITSAIEGCGHYSYYFPLSADRTLFVSRAIVTEFQPIITDYQTYLNVPGVIPPAEEESYFTNILSSFKAKQ
jgi:hypothetical protein